MILQKTLSPTDAAAFTAALVALMDEYEEDLVGVRKLVRVEIKETLAQTPIEAP